MGILGLTHEDLWHVSLGQLYDRIYAHKYKIYNDRIEAAIRASYVARLSNSKQGVSLAELVGEWDDGRIITSEKYGELVLKRQLEEKVKRDGKS